MLADNQPLVSAGDQLSKLKSINKQPSSLSGGIFYAMAQAGIPKASLEGIFLGGGLIVGGLLESLCINYNKIISGIFNYIPSPSNIWYLVKKTREAAFMRIAGFFCNYIFSMSCNNVERSGFGHLVKEIALWGGE